MKNLYQILGVSVRASKAEIRKAFRTKSKDLHPDTNPGKDQLPFQDLVDARQILMDDRKRARYNRGEDPNSLSSEARGLEVAIQTFQEVLRQTLGSIETTEPVILSVEAISKRKLELQQELKKKKEVIQKLKATKKRLTLKDKTQIDYLGNLIEADLKMEIEIIGLLKDKIEACGKATEILNNYDFETDTPAETYSPTTHIHMSSTTS